MPIQKDLKRLVRARMQKTGESYTSARAHLVRQSPGTATPRLEVSRSRDLDAAPLDFAKLAGMSDTAIKAKTGCPWKKWVDTLDGAGAVGMSHRAIAEMVHDTFHVGDWWAQAVTVGYERIKGMREIGQRRSGEYEANRSQTYNVPVGRLFQAFKSARTRNRWLPGVQLTVRKATPDRSMRITWEDETSVEVWFVKKGDSKSTAQVAHRKLASREEISARKAYWGERLQVLGEILG